MIFLFTKKIGSHKIIFYCTNKQSLVRRKPLHLDVSKTIRIVRRAQGPGSPPEGSRRRAGGFSSPGFSPSSCIPPWCGPGDTDYVSLINQPLYVILWLVLHYVILMVMATVMVMVKLSMGVRVRVKVGTVLGGGWTTPCFNPMGCHGPGIQTEGLFQQERHC